VPFICCIGPSISALAGQVIIWDLAKASSVVALEGHVKAVHAGSSKSLDSFNKLCGNMLHRFAVGCSPLSRVIASSSGDKTIRLWDLDTHQPKHVCKGHLKAVSSHS
jgi:WD40 repeat protein